MIGKIVKITTFLISSFNQRIFTIVLFIIGLGAGIYYVPAVLSLEVTKKEAMAIILMLILPYLIMKAIILLMLLFLDISINFSAKRSYIYRQNYEKVKVRIARLFLDKNIRYSMVDNFDFGIEKYLATVLQRYIAGSNFNYPTNFISNKPFVVARVYDLKNGTTQVKVLFEEERDAEVIGRLIIATVDALDRSDYGTPRQQDFMGIGQKPQAEDSQKQAPPQAADLPSQAPQKSAEEIDAKASQKRKRK